MLISDSIVYSGTDADIYLNVINGTPAYSYIWENDNLEETKKPVAVKEDVKKQEINKTEEEPKKGDV